MSAIATYVFLDLQTTGLPRLEHNKSKITELSLIAVKKKHLLDSSKQNPPRVQNKLTLCFYPRKPIQDDITKITGLSNELLEQQSPFDENSFITIKLFLDILKKPICLVAYNGNRFDFPILKRQLVNLNVALPEDVLCADSFLCYYDILYNIEKSQNSITSYNTKEQQENEDQFILDDIHYMQSNTTSTWNKYIPKSANNASKINRVSKVCRKLLYNEGDKSQRRQKLTDVYDRLLGCSAENSHTTEGDCFLMLECSVVLGEKFVQWMEENCQLFSEIEPMTIGVRL